jgi:hypothetical protein
MNQLLSPIVWSAQYKHLQLSELNLDPLTTIQTTQLKMFSLTPKDPAKVTVIRKISENITIASAPFYRFGLIKVGGRGTFGIFALTEDMTMY